MSLVILGGAASMSSAFNPKKIPGCVLWLRSDLGVTKDTSSPPLVSAWADQSTSGNNATQSGADVLKFTFQTNQIATHPSLRADGTAKFMLANGVASYFNDVGGNPAPISVFWVTKNSNNINDSYPWCAGKEDATSPFIGAFDFSFKNGFRRRADDSTLLTSLDGFVDNDWHVWLMVFRADGTFDLYKTGVKEIDNATLNPGAITAIDRFWLASRKDVGFSNVEFAEFGIYSAAISGANVAALNNYLIGRYGL